MRKRYWYYYLNSLPILSFLMMIQKSNFNTAFRFKYVKKRHFTLFKAKYRLLHAYTF